jgi:hypothetical protein
VVVSIDSRSDRNPTSPLVESGDDVDKVPQGAAEPVGPPHHERVAPAQRLEDLVQLRAPLQGAGGVVGPDSLAACGRELVDLQVRIMLRGGYPGVAEQMTQGPRG